MRVAGVALAALVAACAGGGSPAPVVPSPDALAVLTRAGNAAPAVEFCNGLDDDGNGFADERYACVRGAVESCVTPCNSWGTHTCSVACTWGDCAPGAELCNGQDDDCDGRADEDFGCVAGTTTLCDAQPRGKGVSRCDEHCVPT
ncbi:hypothetical protein L6V77_33735, partial [Myxococcota bacterium]|nr:hypothetical protein [Myxococcota bacterium]